MEMALACKQARHTGSRSIPGAAFPPSEVCRSVPRAMQHMCHMYRMGCCVHRMGPGDGELAGHPKKRAAQRVQGDAGGRACVRLRHGRLCDVHRGDRRRRLGRQVRASAPHLQHGRRHLGGWWWRGAQCTGIASPYKSCSLRHLGSRRERPEGQKRFEACVHSCNLLTNQTHKTLLHTSDLSAHGGLQWSVQHCRGSPCMCHHHNSMRHMDAGGPTTATLPPNHDCYVCTGSSPPTSLRSRRAPGCWCSTMARRRSAGSDELGLPQRSRPAGLACSLRLALLAPHAALVACSRSAQDT